MSDSKEKTCNDDSKQPILVTDLVRSILERLTFVDFHRARCISSQWYSTSESCNRVVINPTTPWIILFPNELVDNNNKDSCKLFNPRDKSSYIVRDLGFDLARSRCLASSGSWFLMLDQITNFHLLNLFTRVRIPLPSLESTDGWKMKFKKMSDDSGYTIVSGNHSYGEKIKIDNAVLWLDETSRDYLVVWNLASVFAYHKKGDNIGGSWKVFQPLEIKECCVDMVLKEKKLYVLCNTQNVIVFDFVGVGTPVKCATFQFIIPDREYPLLRAYNHHKRLAVTLSGEVLIVMSVSSRLKICSLYVYKMDPKSSKWGMINSLGGESLVLDLGVTVAAKVMKNCIYYTNDQFHRNNEISLCNNSNNNGICVYHNRTNIVVEVFEHLTASSTVLFKDARWFFPTFGEKWLL